MSAAVSFPSFNIRIETPEDRNYVLGHWRYEAKKLFGQHEGPYFDTLQDGEMAAILARDSTVVTVAYTEKDPSTILGYLVARPATEVIRKGPSTELEIGPAPIVYFIFIRQEMRRCGLARMLLGSLSQRSDVLFSLMPGSVHDGKRGWFQLEKLIPKNWLYCPRAAFVEVP